MKFGEKLRELTAKINKRATSRAAGLPPNAINDYIKKNYVPRADTALALARALNVPLDWLVDETRDCPAPDHGAKPQPENLSDKELMMELVRRYQREIKRVHEHLDALQSINWEPIAAKLKALPPGAVVPDSLRSAADLARASRYLLTTSVQRYDVPFWAYLLNDDDGMQHYDGDTTLLQYHIEEVISATPSLQDVIDDVLRREPIKPKRKKKKKA